MGDGRLLEILAKRNPNYMYIGIELDNDQCVQAQSRITLPNVTIINSSFEDIVPKILDESVDQFIIVLPDPAFIDQKKEKQWMPFYKFVYSKLKKHGRLQLITELTDDLLEPISDDHYSAWAQWLKSCFLSIGFMLASQEDGAPGEYSSRCIDQFRGDPERIRMITLDLVKH